MNTKRTTLSLANLEVMINHLSETMKLCPEFTKDIEGMIDYYSSLVIDETVATIRDFTRIHKKFLSKAIGDCHHNVDDCLLVNGNSEFSSSELSFMQECFKFHKEGKVGKLIDEMYSFDRKSYEHLISEEEKIMYVQNMLLEESYPLKKETRTLLKIRFKETILNSAEYAADKQRIKQIIKIIKDEAKQQKLVDSCV